MTQKTYVKNIKTLLKRAETEVYRDVVESQRLLDIASTLSKENKDDQMLLEVSLTKILISFSSDASTDVYDSLNHIIRDAEKLNNFYILSKSYNLLGHISTKWGLYENASQFFDKSLYYAEKNDDLLMQYEIYNAKGELAMCYRQYEVARTLFKRSLEIGNKCDRAMLLPLIHANMGRVYFYEEKLDLSLEELQIAKNLLNSKHSKEVWGNVFYLSGQYKRRMGQYDAAIDQLELGIGYFNSINRICASAPLYKEISDMYLNTHDVSRALHNYMEALEIADFDEPSKECKLFVGCLAEIYEQIGMEKEAFDHYKTYRKINDTLDEKSLYHKIRTIEFK